MLGCTHDISEGHGKRQANAFARQAEHKIIHAVWAAQELLRLPSHEAHAETSNRWDTFVVIYQVVPSLPACQAMLMHADHLKMSLYIVKKALM